MLLLCGYYLYTVIGARNKFGKVWYIPVNLVAVFGSALVPYIIWARHAGDQFSNSKHTVSLSGYKQIFLEKDAYVTAAITEKFLAALTDLTTIPFQGIILFHMIMISAYLIIRFLIGRQNSLLRCTLLVDLIIAAYYSGIYFMFLFSMPTEEALVLAGFERYASSIIIFSLGIAMMVLSREIDYSLFEQASQKQKPPELQKPVHQKNLSIKQSAPAVLCDDNAPIRK